MTEDFRAVVLPRRADVTPWASGLLVTEGGGRNRQGVLVPDPPPPLLPPEVELDALVFPAQPSSDLPVERARVVRAHRYQADGGSEAVLYVLERRLHEVAVFMGRTGDVGEARARHGGALWPALDDLGLLPPDGLPIVTEEELRATITLEQEQSRVTWSSDEQKWWPDPCWFVRCR